MEDDITTTTVYISNIHCATCTSLIDSTLSSLSHIRSFTSSIMTNRVVVQHSTKLSTREITEALFFAGFEIDSCVVKRGDEEIVEAIPVKSRYWLDHFVHGSSGKMVSTRMRKRHIDVCRQCQQEKEKTAVNSPVICSLDGNDGPKGIRKRGMSLQSLQSVKVDEKQVDLWNASLSIQGMTCSSCVGTVRAGLEDLTFIEKMDISALTHGGTIVFRGKENAQSLVDQIESLGYDAQLLEVNAYEEENYKSKERTMALKVDGLHCPSCPPRVMEVFNAFPSGQLSVLKELTEKDPIVRFKYTPQPDITTRIIKKRIEELDEGFKVTVYHAESVEERSATVHRKELRRIAIRLALSVVIAIPTFIIGIVFMSLLKSNHPLRKWVEEPVWAGSVTRAEWATFILATPVYVFAADLFHVRAFTELRGLWSRKNPKPIWKKFVKFGSMNLLMSLGTTIAFFASLALLILDARSKPMEMHGKRYNATFFDAVVFLTMFLLSGRLLESYSKGKTADAVSMLVNLRPTEALLVINESTDTPHVEAHRIPVELLEIGDCVVVLHGQSPPSDGKIVSGSSRFDDSSLTGESKPVTKSIGDEVFAGTVNQGAVVSVEITSVSGKTMLDQIVQVVRDGQGQRAPIERVADLITGFFVPVVSYLAVLVWIIWLSLGVSGRIPQDWLDMDGGWAVWSLQFAIAVFVIACPCGIGLAAPTALFIGTELAAKYGILAKGGGEAFQEASSLDVVVFDKTGTLTLGGEPSITDEHVIVKDVKESKIIMSALERLEMASSHPLAKAVIKYTANEEKVDLASSDIEEHPGYGVTGTFKIGNRSIFAIVGNEALLDQHHISIPSEIRQMIRRWQESAKSIIFLATNTPNSSLHLSMILAASDPIRPEAPTVIKQLRNKGLSIYMLSGDNPTTAAAVALSVGIDAENVIAGVLPHQKAERIAYLQRTAKIRSYYFSKKKRPTVAFVGDGINDAPALTTADVGIAIGSGSDIAISSASFILVKSNLHSIITLLNLSTKVMQRVRFNFFWAGIYNIIGIPIAAGALYWKNRTRLDPAWAALAMAGSSVSVVVSSLLLRWRIWGVGFRGRREE